jgi:hypothetical protein
MVPHLTSQHVAVIASPVWRLAISLWSYVTAAKRIFCNKVNLHIFTNFYSENTFLSLLFGTICIAGSLIVSAPDEALRDDPSRLQSSVFFTLILCSDPPCWHMLSKLLLLTIIFCANC